MFVVFYCISYCNMFRPFWKTTIRQCKKYKETSSHTTQHHFSFPVRIMFQVNYEIAFLEACSVLSILPFILEALVNNFNIFQCILLFRVCMVVALITHITQLV